jgi:hypothetical protein
MASKRTPIGRGARAHISQEATAAWLAGDVQALKAALNLGPWEHSPLPYDYTFGFGLPDEPTEGRGWAKCKRFQEELVSLVGWPPAEVKRAAHERRLQEEEERLTYLQSAMARTMYASREDKYAAQIQDAEERIALLQATLEDLGYETLT